MDQSQLKLEILDDLISKSQRRVDSQRFGLAKRFMTSLNARGFMLISITTYDRLVKNQRTYADVQRELTDTHHLPHQPPGEQAGNGGMDAN